MCPDWWLNTALVGSAVRTLTEDPGNQGVANRAETVRTEPENFSSFVRSTSVRRHLTSVRIKDLHP